MIRTSNRIVANAVQWVAANGDRYFRRCPQCDKANFNGHCSKCGLTLSPSDMKKMMDHKLWAADGKVQFHKSFYWDRRLRRYVDLEVGWPEVKKTATEPGKSGFGQIKMMTKHRKEFPMLTTTLAGRGSLPTTKGTKIGGVYDPNRRAVPVGEMIAYLKRHKSGRWSVATQFASEKEVRDAYEIARGLKKR